MFDYLELFLINAQYFKKLYNIFVLQLLGTFIITIPQIYFTVDRL
jgi:hypothetical protein